MTDERYELTEERVNEAESLIEKYSQILFGPKEEEDLLTILRGLLQLSPDTRSMLSAQIKIFTAQ